MSDQHNEFKNRIAANVRKYRVMAGLTQQELADRLNERMGTSIRNNTISSWENAVNSIDNDYIVPIAEVLGVSINSIYGQQEADYSSEPDTLARKIDILAVRERTQVEAYVDYLLWKRTDEAE